jgi:HK97 family phage major capsid protein
MRAERARLIAEARDKWTVAEKREAGPSAEDKAEFDRLMKAAGDLKERYERAERLEAEEAGLDAVGERRGEPVGDRPRGGATCRTAAEYRASAEYKAVFSHWLTTGQVRYGQIPGEFRDTIIGTDAKGGFLSTPVQLANEIVKVADDFVFMRSLATVITMGEAKAFGIPQLTTRMGDANWTTEVQAVTEDTTMAVGRRDLTPILLSKLSKVSIRMLYGNANVEQFLTAELGYKFGITQEKGFLTGSGSGQPLGIFTASASGIPTGRDVSTGNTTTAIGATNLFELKYSLKVSYRNDPTCRWLWSRTAINAIMQLKDSQNRYLWEPSLQAGQPDRLLNIMVAESEYVPATFTTGLYVGAIGAMRNYWIAQVADLQIQRLVERYADTNEVGFIGRMYLDGSPALGEAFSRSKLA